MELLFESTNKFEKDLNQFDDQEKGKIVKKLNEQCASLKDGLDTFYKKVVRPLKIKLNNGLEPSLYCLKVNRDVRIIITVDDDPLFDQIIITLMRVVRHNQKDIHSIFLVRKSDSG